MSTRMHTHVSLAHELISLKRQGLTLAEGGYRRTRLTSSSLPITASGSHSAGTALSALRLILKPELCENSREERGRLLSLDWYRLSSGPRKPSPHTASSPSSHLGTWQPPGRSLGELQVRGRVGGNVGQWCWYGGHTQRDRHLETERGGGGRGGGGASHTCEREGGGRGHQDESPFRSFSSSC